MALFTAVIQVVEFTRELVNLGSIRTSSTTVKLRFVG